VIYEIAQVKLIIKNTSPDSVRTSTEGITVHAEDEVCCKHHVRGTAAYESQNAQIRTHLTPSGLLFATLSLDTPTFEEYFVGLEDLTNKVDFTKLPHRRSISYEGRFNWKTMFVPPS
jgi:hypothetical protein